VTVSSSSSCECVYEDECKLFSYAHRTSSRLFGRSYRACPGRNDRNCNSGCSCKSDPGEPALRSLNPHSSSCIGFPWSVVHIGSYTRHTSSKKRSSTQVCFHLLSISISHLEKNHTIKHAFCSPETQTLDAALRPPSRSVSADPPGP
jgi:hypothetical protein